MDASINPTVSVVHYFNSLLCSCVHFACELVSILHVHACVCISCMCTCGLCTCLIMHVGVHELEILKENESAQGEELFPFSFITAMSLNSEVQITQ